jgi:glucosylceramidase
MSICSGKAIFGVISSPSIYSGQVPREIFRNEFKGLRFLPLVEMTVLGLSRTDKPVNHYRLSKEDAMNSEKNRWFALCLFMLAATSLFAQTAFLRTSTNTNRWVDGGAITGTAWTSTSNYFEVLPNTTYQTILGFGGCFCEIGWSAIQSLTNAAARDSVIRALFDTSGCNYNFCRIAVGANDFANAWYSYNETSGDNSMANFSISRELTNNIAFIKAAQVYQPNMRFWASPWSPPTWMKSSGTYNGGNMKNDATTFNAYALYLSKTVQAFKDQGINIELITCQNEPDQCSQNYPTCCWTNTNEINFYANYMIPRFNQDGLTTKILIGVYCCGNYSDWVTPFWNNATVAAKIGAVSHSWQTTAWGQQNWSEHPSTPFFETEADWGQNAVHDWGEGVNQWNSRVNFLTTGKAAVFEAWNMVLDERYASNWGFKQSAPININRSSHVVTYEPHYWADKHISHFVKAGAKAINMTTAGSNPGSKAAFLNPNGDIIVVAANTGSSAYQATIKSGNMMYKATFPANSFNTMRISNASAAQGRELEKKSMPVLSKASIRNATLYLTLSAAEYAKELDLSLIDMQGRTVWTGRRGGKALHGEHLAFAIQPTQGGLPHGSYLLSVRIKNRIGSVTAVEKNISVVE